MKKLFYLICLIVWLYIIYFLSNQNGLVSGDNSGNIIKYYLEIFNFSNNTEQFIEIIHNPLRELMHIFEYFVLGFLVIKNLKNFKIKEKIYIITILFNFIYASFDEIHQLFIVGRSFEYYDIFMDMLGTILVILLFNIKFKKIEKTSSVNICN